MSPTEEDVAWFQSTFRPIPRPTLPEDCIEYTLHLISSDTDANNDSESRLKLREVQKYAGDTFKKWLKDYIWQRQGFSLEMVKEDGLRILRGRTEYGDSIEDEWVIVWLLREVTKKFKNIWIKVTDNDGEFLLIEASGTIPAWLEPEVAENRVWINDGQLKIVKPARDPKSSKRTSEKLTVQEARRVILTDPKRIMHSISIEEEAFYRLRNYPAQIKENMHHALVRLPRKVTFLLRQKPAYISPAVEAFYLRDPVSLRALQKNKDIDSFLFAPQDFVTMSVKFPRAGYAQIKSQEFSEPPVWTDKMPSRLEEREFARADVGMKVTCGFEILLTDSHYQDKQQVREMKLLLEDLEQGEESLPTDKQLDKLDKAEDDEKWMDISLDDLDHELGGNSNGGADGKKREFGDKATQENLQRLVQQFEKFLNDDDNEIDDDSDDLEEDDELDSEDDSGEDKDASFNEEEFAKMIQEMMGMPPEVMKEVMSGEIDALSGERTGRISDEVHRRAKSRVEELDTSDEEDIVDSKQMEAELRASGALNLETIGQASSSSRPTLKDKGKDTEDDSEDHSDVDGFDAEFARNILQSFRSSGGTGGPAANLLSMLDEPAHSKTAKSSKPK